VKRLIVHPELCKYVQKVDLGRWSTLDTLYYYREEGEHADETDFDAVHTEPNLQHIELEQCCLRTEEVQTLLQACTNLKSFPYRSGGDAIGVWNPSPAKIVELLDPFKYVLERLCICINIERCEGWSNQQQPQRIQSIAHMTALKVVGTSPDIWHGAGHENVWKFLDKTFRLRRRQDRANHSELFALLSCSLLG
jgi:hypothetical protein